MHPTRSASNSRKVFFLKAPSNANIVFCNIWLFVTFVPFCFVQLTYCLLTESIAIFWHSLLFSGVKNNSGLLRILILGEGWLSSLCVSPHTARSCAYAWSPGYSHISTLSCQLSFLVASHIIPSSNSCKLTIVERHWAWWTSGLISAKVVPVFWPLCVPYCKVNTKKCCRALLNMVYLYLYLASALLCHTEANRTVLINTVIMWLLKTVIIQELSNAVKIP